MAVTSIAPVSVFADDEETFKIGVIGPMTGDYAQYGNGVHNAAKIAADEINENGGFNGYKVEILDAQVMIRVILIKPSMHMMIFLTRVCRCFAEQLHPVLVSLLPVKRLTAHSCLHLLLQQWGGY